MNARASFARCPSGEDSVGEEPPTTSVIALLRDDTRLAAGAVGTTAGEYPEPHL
jgi:hypothetical protein